MTSPLKQHSWPSAPINVNVETLRSQDSCSLSLILTKSNNGGRSWIINEALDSPEGHLKLPASVSHTSMVLWAPEAYCSIDHSLRSWPAESTAAAGVVLVAAKYWQSSFVICDLLYSKIKCQHSHSKVTLWTLKGSPGSHERSMCFQSSIIQKLWTFKPFLQMISMTTSLWFFYYWDQILHWSSPTWKNQNTSFWLGVPRPSLCVCVCGLQWYFSIFKPLFYSCSFSSWHRAPCFRGILIFIVSNQM